MPKIKLTKTAIDTLPPAAKGQAMYWDKDLSGFGLIVGKSSKTFIAQKDIRGRSIRCTIGRYGHFTVDEARRIAKDKLYHLSLGKNPNELDQQARKRLITVEQALTEYLSARRNLKPSTREDYPRILTYLENWRSKPLVEITKDMIGAQHKKIAEENGTYVANKTMRILRALFNFVQCTYDICPANPVLYLTHTKGWYKETRRRSYIKPTELADWWVAVGELENDTYRDFLLLLLFTGLRRGEAAQLRWTDISFRDRSFTVLDTKNGDPLTLPLSDYLLGLLETRRQRYGNYEYVFPGPGAFGHLAEPKKGIYKVAQATGISFSCHDLRRTFITIAESLEISTYALKRLINHRVTDVTGGYIIIDVERLRSPAQRIEQYILEKIGANKKTDYGAIDKA